MRFHFHKEEELVWEGYSSNHPYPLISKLKANKMMSKGLLCHIFSVKDLDHDNPSKDSVLVLNELLVLFADDLPKVPPCREIYFGIDFEPDISQFWFFPTDWLQLNSKS